MGYNTTLIIMNDALSAIREDRTFGNKIASAVSKLNTTNIPQDIASFGYSNAATVIESHHADETAVVAIGGNYASLLGTALGDTHHDKESQIRILKELAKQFGFVLIPEEIMRIS